MVNEVIFNVYKSYFEMNLFTETDIRLFAEVGYLTQEQADQILKPATTQAQA